MFRRILIANRGEIAVRIIRACRELGIAPIAVYSEVDRDALHVQLADRAVPIGPAPAPESYLSIDALVEAARTSGAKAIHPGYGFLSENAAFARAVGEAGLTFIGPSPETIELAGDKVRARKVAAEAGAPVLPATEPVEPGSIDRRDVADRIGYPLLVKAAAGGGGKGMRVVAREEGLQPALEAASREATSAFGDGRVFLEKLVERPRHIEVQILADGRGNCIHLGERECSLQRRHQKIVEEAPSPVVDEELRSRMTDAALRVARATDYVNAGTVELLLGNDGAFYFLEINSRLQVEHPVTELVTGVDLVVEQIRIAAGEPLSIRQEDVHLRGHAFESRVYAEDPANHFFPASGIVTAVSHPSGPGVRVDSSLWSGATIPLEYDPMLAKLIVWGPGREPARRRMLLALEDFLLLGPPNNLRFLRDLIALDEVRDGRMDTQLVERLAERWGEASEHLELAALVAGATVAGGAVAAPGGDGGRSREIPSPWESLGAFRLGTKGTTR